MAAPKFEKPAITATINHQVGAHKRLASKPIDEKYYPLIQSTIENGYVIIKDAFSPSQVHLANTTIHTLSQNPLTAGPACHGGRNAFEGPLTQRIYALLNKSRVFDAFALHPAVLALNDYFLDPGWLLNTMHSISILPGSPAQTMHHDDGSITIPRPHKPFGTAIMVALDEYNPTNGSTVVVPKSHVWGNTPIPPDSSAIPILMPAGSIVFFLGTLWHGGGANTSCVARRALTVQYCQPWVRPLENQFLAVDWEKVVSGEIPERLVDAMGYQVSAPFVGFVDGISPRNMVRRRLGVRRGVGEEREGKAKL
ncbi:hypothetical protein NX059_009361 [Plenodomus lindquistii]|nr:hypothetical protein NX059_009361 [Plenodomus lindquistii]